MSEDEMNKTEEEKINEDLSVEETSTDESEEVEEEIKEEVAAESVKSLNDTITGVKPSFISVLGACVADKIIVFLVSFPMLYLFDIILQHTAGYQVTDKTGVFLIIFIVIDILYTIIMESVKGFTVGKLLFCLNVVRK